MTTQQREAFQVWAADKGLNLSSFGGIKYNSGTTQIVWEAWQAAQQAQGEAATEQQLIDAQRSQGAGIHPQPAHQVPEGWKLVPIDPTPEMLSAGREKIEVWQWKEKGRLMKEMRFKPAVWNAMLDNAPTPTQEQ